MQDRYVGDVGDFGKYGLLRSLCGADEYGAALRLGVLWYRFDGNEMLTANDGRHTEYLLNPSRHERRLLECDTDLFQKMQQLVTGNARSVPAVEASGALPADTLFFNSGLNFDQTLLADQRDAKRRNWLNAGLREVEEAEVVFVDPDNGLEVPSCGRLSPKGPKYAYYDDLRPCWARDQSLVIYHHLGRTYKGRKADAGEQIARLGEDLRREVPGAEPIALRYRRRSPRVYFVLPKPEHANRLKARIEAFLASPWGGADPPHFERAAC